ncbi:hypothetical protein L226DRAFT_612220 [Lentinus tigrinus ALCF2SS1-7]|uniref:HAD-like protein n=1 Tax=Lentinus tigrinus ALCF2SS1-6 TaxID=1328759 RepID=A0A5C2SEW6_9APHY|nr:hypothetical protein L227DRAFT_610241 [Lentinus tigrinus ALCF2SS1-6]RPD75953.1 hypothetical protein L226DRAFT_612220 [Lentinus tigrinus ALCF2SS1-7]
MPHTFLPVKFNPAKSAYWLPSPGQRAAARMPTRWFWALWISLLDPDNYDDNTASGDPCPMYLFVVASTPSPYPNVPKSSFTLGPRVAEDTGTLVGNGAELLTHASHGPFASIEREIHKPLYLHTVPAIRFHMFARPPLDFCYFALKEESLRKFTSGARESLLLAEQYRAHALETYGYDAIKNGWTAPTTDAGRMRFGDGLNDPHAYAFDLDEFPIPVPCLEQRPMVYGELMKYRQLCVDYRWKGVTPTIDWVLTIRQTIRERRAISSTSRETTLPHEPCLDPALRAHAISLYQARRIVQVETVKDEPGSNQETELGSDPHSPSRSPPPSHSPLPPHSPSSPHSASSSTWTFASFFRETENENLPWTWPDLPVYYPIIPFATPKLIAFDLIGTLLDRQGAIVQALSVLQSHLDDTNAMGIDALLERFITLEALAARSSRVTNSPTSLPTLARTALFNLSQELDLDLHEDDPQFTLALKYILDPHPYVDVEHALSTLVQRGYTLICLPTHSETTTQRLLSRLPDVFSAVWSQSVSLHVTTDAVDFFDGFDTFCREFIGASALRNEVLVVSSSIGRVLHAATFWGLGTALIRRPGNLEGNVDFSVGDPEFKGNPIPSLVVRGLDELCTKV